MELDEFGAAAKRVVTYRNERAVAKARGIIVLGGALNPELAAARGTPQALTISGSRITEATALALRLS